MSRHSNVLIAAAAALVSTALIVPTTSAVAQGWSTTSYDHAPMVRTAIR